MAELEEDLFQQECFVRKKQISLREKYSFNQARNAISLQADLEIAKLRAGVTNDATHVVVEKENRLLESQKLIEQKDNTIASQTETVQELEATIKNLTARVNDGMDRAAESQLLEGRYAEVKAENEILKENVSKLNEQNETLNKQVNILRDTADSHVTLSNDIIQKTKTCWRREIN